MFDTFKSHYRNAQRVIGRVKLDDIRRRELAEAQLQKQENESRRDYYASMVAYDATRIRRLERQLAQCETVNLPHAVVTRAALLHSVRQLRDKP